MIIQNPGAIAQYILLAVLGAVTVETQGLVGHELLTHGVDSSSNGDTAIIASAKRPAWEGGKEKVQCI